jgi:hypothetical protein
VESPSQYPVRRPYAPDQALPLVSRLSRGLLLLCFEGLLAVAAYHDDGQEAADDGGAEDDEDDGDADGPDAREEEGVEEVVVVDEWLRLLVGVQRVCMAEVCTMKSVQMV